MMHWQLVLLAGTLIGSWLGWIARGVVEEEKRD